MSQEWTWRRERRWTDIAQHVVECPFRDGLRSRMLSMKKNQRWSEFIKQLEADSKTVLRGSR